MATLCTFKHLKSRIKIEMVTLTLYFAFFALIGQIFAGDFVNKVSVDYNLFSVLEDDDFRLTCTATHEDKKPQLRWYFVNLKYVRTNLTGFIGGAGSGKTETRTYTKSSVKTSNSGDYFCEAKVDNDIQGSAGVPILVLTKESKPRVMITKSLRFGKTFLNCNVVPQGRGDLQWRQDGSRIKYENKIATLELDPPSSREEYECYGNVTVAGFMFFQSSAYATAAAGWSKMTTQAVFLPSVLTALFTLINSLSLQ